MQFFSTFCYLSICSLKYLILLMIFLQCAEVMVLASRIVLTFYDSRRHRQNVFIQCKHCMNPPLARSHIGFIFPTLGTHAL